MIQVPTYRHDLGRGLYIDAFSLDPELTSDKLSEIVCTTDGKGKLVSKKVSSEIRHMAHLDSLFELTFDYLGLLGDLYQVPECLREYRESIQADWDSKGRFNGPVIIVQGELKNPLRVVQGGHYDFAATKLSDEPGKLLPNKYPQGKTVEDILVANGMSIEERARYFGLAHLMWPSNGKEFLLVRRAKGMGIADDVISTPGSTPDLVLNKPGLKKPGFGVKEYWSYHLAQEMKDEFHLLWGDFWLGGLDLYEDDLMTPFGAINIFTELSIAEIARQAYDDPRVLKEHDILYSMTPETIPTFLERFPVYPAVVKALELVLA